MTVVKVVSGCVLVALALALQGCGDSATSTTSTPLGCQAGYDKNETNKDTKCKFDAASCLAILTTCCSVNVKTCANEAKGICGDDKYKDPTKNGNDAGTGDEKKTNCCSSVATCANVECEAGYKKKDNDPSTKKCRGAVSSCRNCCVASADKCASQASNICGSGKYKDSKKNGNDAGTTADDKKKNCCSDVTQATCGDVTCPAGYQQKTNNPSTVKCSGAVSTCQGCCKVSEGKCGKEAEIICGDGKYRDPTKKGDDAGTTADEKKTNCCTDKATCSAFWESR